MKVYVDGQLVGVFRTRPDGRYQRRIHSQVYTRDDLQAWVERMNRRSDGRTRWRIEDDGKSNELAVLPAGRQRVGLLFKQTLLRKLHNGRYLIACMNGINSNLDLDVLIDWGIPRSGTLCSTT